MNQGELKELVEEVRDREFAWRRQRWVQLVLGALFLLYGFATIYFRRALPPFLDPGERVFFSVIGGYLIGTTCHHWSGGIELGMLSKFKAHFEAADDRKE
ncbi:MAG: hypothetical protein V4582_03605 [Pseudomonadota bacterium]